MGARQRWRRKAGKKKNNRTVTIIRGKRGDSVST